MTLMPGLITAVAGALAIWALAMWARERGRRTMLWDAAQSHRRRTRELERQIEAQTSDSRESEARLRGYLQILDALVNTIPNPICYSDPDGIFLGCNQSFARDILGLSRDRIIGNRPQEMSGTFAPATASVMRHHELKVFDSRKPMEYEASLACTDGREREFLFCVAPVFDNHDAPTGTVTVMMDLTDRNRAAQEGLAKTKLEGVLETAGAVCHELNQPLQALRGYADLALMAEDDDQAMADLVSKTQDQIDRMATITDKLQRITRVETRAVSSKTSIIDLDKSTELRSARFEKIPSETGTDA